MSANFKNHEALEPVRKVIDEANEAVKNPERTMKDSPIKDVLGAAIGAGAGGGISFAALYGLGTVGLSASGITSALAAAGSLVGGGMVAGIFVLALPVAGLSVLGYDIFNRRRKKQLQQAKERIYQQAIQARDAIINELKKTTADNAERLKYLESLNTLLQRAIVDLNADLAA